MRKYLAFLGLVILLAGCQAQAKSKIGQIKIDGKKFQLTDITLEKPGYLVVRELTPAGEPASVVGLTPLLPEKQTKDIVVAVPGMKAATSYRLSIYLDNGDNIFVLSEDTPALQGKKEIYKDIQNP